MYVSVFVHMCAYMCGKCVIFIYLRDMTKRRKKKNACLVSYTWLTLYLKDLVPVDNTMFFQQLSVSIDIFVEHSIGISIMVQVVCLSLGQKTWSQTHKAHHLWSREPLLCLRGRMGRMLSFSIFFHIYPYDQSQWS